jgi:hypothetical protein
VVLGELKSAPAQAKAKVSPGMSLTDGPTGRNANQQEKERGGL